MRHSPDAFIRRLPLELAVALGAWGMLLAFVGWQLGPPSAPPPPRPLAVQLAPPPPGPKAGLGRPASARPRPARPRARRPAAPVTRPIAPAPVQPAPAAPAPAAPAPPAPPAEPTEAGDETALGGTASGGAQALWAPLPELPAALRVQVLEAEAVARFHIASDGSFTVTLLTPTAHPRLNQLLLEALKGWRFSPAMRDGHPVASEVDVRIPITVR